MALALEGKAPAPMEYRFGRLSEEFGGALPSVVLAEMQRLPAGFLEQIVEYRAFAAAWFANQADAAGWQASPMRTLAKEIEHALAEEELESDG